MPKTKNLFCLLLSFLMLCSLMAPVALPMQTLAASASKTVQLSKTTASVYNGKTLKLKVKNTKQKVTWSTGNKKIATVKNGVVTPKKAGKVTIKAKVGGKTLKCTVTVKSALKASVKELTIVKGKAKKATITLYLPDGDVECKIGKPSVASYKFGDWNGKKIALKFTAKKAGKTTATITNSETNDVCKIKLIVTEPVKPPETKPLTANTNLISLDLNETQTVALTALPESQIVVSVAQPSIAKCTWSGVWTNGQTSVSITGLANGSTTLTLIHASSGQSVKLPVTVGCVHVFSDDFRTETAPTCTQPGIAYKHCLNCGVRGESKEVPALGHTFAETFTVDTPSTCTKEGVQSRHCLVCGAKTDEKPVEKAPHDYGGFTVLKEASCIATGSKTRLCRICGAQDNQVIPQTDHNYSADFTIDVQPTCTTVGSKSRHCKTCGAKTEITEIPATGSHNFGDWVVTKAATCTATGEETATCTVCGEKKTRKIDMLKHTFSTEFTVDTPATCGGKGSKSKHCTICGEKSEITEIPATGEHDFETTMTIDKEATCGEKGSMSYHCKNCGEKKDITDIPATGNHTFGDWTKDGDKESRTCSVCGEKETRDPQPAAAQMPQKAAAAEKQYVL